MPNNAKNILIEELEKTSVKESMPFFLSLLKGPPNETSGDDEKEEFIRSMQKMAKIGLTVTLQKTEILKLLKCEDFSDDTMLDDAALRQV